MDELLLARAIERKKAVSQAELNKLRRQDCVHWSARWAGDSSVPGDE